METLRNAELNHIHDKGYKELYSNKQVFLDLLQNMLHLGWAKDIGEADLTLVDKSYVTPDYSELESDLVYRMQLEGKEILIYVLLEFQSTVDYRMPVRLLFYMNEILREFVKDANFTSGNSSVEIPAIFPIVLYNGEKPWNAKLSLREITSHYEAFGDNILDFKYSLIDVNHDYTEADLLENDCISSIIFLLDQNTDVMTLLKRLGEIVERFQSLAQGQNRQIIAHWVSKTTNPILSGQAVGIINANKKEAASMVSNLSTVYERTMRLATEQGEKQGELRGELRGELKGKLEVAKNLLADGMAIAKIAKFTGLSEQELDKHLNQQS